MKVRAFERYIPLKDFAKQIMHIKTRRETFVILVCLYPYIGHSLSSHALGVMNAITFVSLL